MCLHLPVFSKILETEKVFIPRNTWKSFFFIPLCNFNLLLTNWWVSLSKICHEWLNNAVTQESELERYLVMRDKFLIMKFVN